MKLTGHKMCYGPTLVINARKEVTKMNYEEFEAPKAILSIRNQAEEFVKSWYDWYEKHPQQKLTIQNQEEEAIPPAPPCIGGTEE